MSVFGNLHKIATSLIPRTTIYYRLSNGYETSDSGVRTPKYGEWIRIRASVQPGIISSFGGKNVGEKDYKDFGLDFSHIFYTVWADDVPVNTVAKQAIPDQLQIYGKTFNIINVSDWLEYNGWKRFYCEEVIDE